MVPDYDLIEFAARDPKLRSLIQDTLPTTSPPYPVDTNIITYKTSSNSEPVSRPPVNRKERRMLAAKKRRART